MGKATRWIRGLFGIKKDKENVDRSTSNHGEKKEKKRRSFTKPGKDNSFNQIPANTPLTTDAAWLRSYITASEKENNHHAMAVAAATAAAADAAVRAAQAAAAVVMLTNHGRAGLLVGGTEKSAALKIQTVFRGYLARKALRALKCLVKLQALVRGYLVRKRAAATLHSMQALFRAQAAARSQRARHSVHEIRSRKSVESCERDLLNKRLSASYEPYYNNMFDESPKIVEIDTCNGARPRRISTYSTNEYHLDDYHHHMISSSSPLACPNPNRIKVPDNSRDARGYDWGFIEEDYKCATAQSTPRFAFTGRGNVLPITTAKSVSDVVFFRASYDNNFCPNYMTNTQSFKAKSRSYSAPKQRPEPFGSKKRLPLNEIMASRSSFSGVRMQQRQVHEDFEY